jgi:hypothetical protein
VVFNGVFVMSLLFGGFVLRWPRRVS